MIIYIDELNTLPNNEQIEQIDEDFSGLDLAKNVIGKIKIKSMGASIDITGEIAVDIMITCDRCLKDFVEHLNIKIDETFVKGKVYDESHSEIELNIDGLVQELNGSNEIDLSDLIFQNIILNVPNQKLCDINCTGSDELQKLNAEEKIDPRLEIFKDLSDKMKK